MPNRLILLVAAALLLPALAHAQTQSFLKVNLGKDASVFGAPSGARGISMGITGVADPTDPTNVFYNPSVIGLMQGAAITQSYVSWADLPDIKNRSTLDFGIAGAWAFRGEETTSFRVAGSLRFNRYRSEIVFENRTIFLPSGTGRALSFDENEWNANFSLAGAVAVGRFEAALGASVKPARIDFFGETLSGVAFDVGVLSRVTIGGVDGFRLIPSIGASVLNMGDDMRHEQNGIGLDVPLPKGTRVGGGVRLESPRSDAYDAPYLSLAANAEVLDETGEDGGSKNYMGGEVGFLDVLMLRAGYLPVDRDDSLPDDKTGRTTYGLGIAWAFNTVRVGMDYTQIPDFSEGETVESFGLWAFLTY